MEGRALLLYIAMAEVFSRVPILYYSVTTGAAVDNLYQLEHELQNILKIQFIRLESQNVINPTKV
jgi:hypothetical protein